MPRRAVWLFDDLSRLAWDGTLLLMVLHQLQFQDVRVISVADGLDTEDEHARPPIQLRGIVNEVQNQTATRLLPPPKRVAGSSMGTGRPDPPAALHPAFAADGG